MIRSGSLAPTHAGVVAYRVTDGAPEFLLVEATSKRDDWVFPKGHLAQGEAPSEAALREAREEAGVEGRLGTYLGTQAFEAKGERVRVAWWLLETKQEAPSPEARRTRWCSLETALSAVSREEQRDLLRRAAGEVGVGSR